jgi:penicillin-binding protein 1C
MLLAMLGVLISIGLWAFSVPMDRSLLEYHDIASVRILDRQGVVLRTTLGDAGTRAIWTPLDRISPALIQATLAAEDKRFYHHPGVDPVATARAACTNLKARRIVSGGSTLTQQLAGLLWPEPRTFAGKAREAARALRLEVFLSKNEILEQYVNRAPYGPMIQGVGAAAQAHFHVAPDRLGPAQAATLAAMVRQPGHIDDTRALMRRRNLILDRLERDCTLDHDEAREAREAPLTLSTRPEPTQAPHFADWVLASRPKALRDAATLNTTLDARLQSEIETIVREAEARLAGPGGPTQVAVVIESIADPQILAMVGSLDWSDANEGQVNATLARRQPGSALKPFLYAMAFDRGLSPADALADVPMHFVDADGADLSPRNFDGRYRGPVRARVALASSFNVPAVRVQERIGTERAIKGLKEAGLGGFTAGPDVYGLGLTLGVGEVTLLDLTTAYAGLARGGVFTTPRFLLHAEDARGRSLSMPRNQSDRRWCSPQSAFLVQDILADDAARTPGFGRSSVLDLPFPMVVKTGTSTGYRDAWCVGFDADHVIGVWTGNFDGSSARGAGGARSAGPIFREIALRLHAEGSRPWADQPPRGWTMRTVCALSGDRPGDACAGTVLEWFTDQQWAKRPVCTFHAWVGGHPKIIWSSVYREWAERQGLEDASPAALQGPRITSPVNGSVYYLDPRLGGSADIQVSAVDAGGNARWSLDGQRMPPREASFLWAPVPGEHWIEIEAPSGRDQVRFSVR